MKNEDIREHVRSGYGEVARRSSSCCGTSSCCDDDTPAHKQAISLGYAKDDLAAIPEDANLGLGCGNPSAIAGLEPGETVLDLGSGAGMDAFLAASKVGETGQVIGVDMTPEMLARARDTASRRGVSHFVEFRRGLIEDLPVTSDSVDVILSNCVINLSPDKEKVFAEAFRVLKPGGRLAVSDIVLSEPLPEALLGIGASYTACISGAMLASDYKQTMEQAGFVDIEYTRSDAAFLVDGVCSDPVFEDAIEGVDPADLEAARENLWSYRYFARKPQ